MDRRSFFRACRGILATAVIATLLVGALGLVAVASTRRHTGVFSVDAAVNLDPADTQTASAIQTAIAAGTQTAVGSLPTATPTPVSTATETGPRDRIAVAIAPRDPGGAPVLGYVRGLDGNGSFVRNLSASPGLYTTPRWSPDGTMVAYYDMGPPRRLVVTSLSGSELASMPITFWGFATPRMIAWSPRSDAIAYQDSTESGYGRIMLVRLNTGDRTDLVDELGLPADVQYVEPDWSAADRIGFDCGPDPDINRGRDFCFVDGDGANFARRSTGRMAANTGPVWSPDGTIYAFDAPCGIPCGYLVTRSELGDEQWGSLNPNYWTFASPAWAPDGIAVLGVDSQGGGASLYARSGNPTASDLIPILLHVDLGSGAVISPQGWSPDGQQLVIRTEAGTFLYDAATLQPTSGDLGGGGASFRPVTPSTPVPTDTPTPTATPPTPTPPPAPVVILVHGIDPFHFADANCGMNGGGSIEEYINDSSHFGGVKFDTECLGARDKYITRYGVEAGAHALKNLIDRVKRERHVDKVDIVAHSMGGLVSRYYIEQLNGRGNVRSLTMLGTPNLGSNTATLACAAWAKVASLDIFHLLDHPYDAGACDMVPVVSPLLWKLNVPGGSHAGVTYHVLMGIAGQNPIVAAPQDCMVDVLSASKAFTLPTEYFLALHVNGGGPGAFLGCVPPYKGEGEDASVQARVAQILMASNGFSANFNMDTGGGAGVDPDTPTPTPTPPTSEPVPSIIASSSGIITQGQSIDVPITMPASQSTGTFIFQSPDDPSASLTFALLRPGGAPAVDGDVDVTYDSGTGFGGLDQTQFTIANPAAGTWTMRVTGTTAPQTGWPYDVEALVPGGISVTADAGAGHYDTGQPFDLSADVAVNDVPYTGATVHAVVTRPDQTTADVAFTDAGGGSYTGTFADTAACGLYQVTVIAEGDDNGTPFSRQDRTLAFAGVPGNVILDPCVADSDGDGLTDKDEIDIYNTNPASADTDGDGYSDPREIGLGEDPVEYCGIMRADVNLTADPLVRGNGVINSLDLFAVAKVFGPNRGTVIEDQNGDGNINSLDLLLVAKKFAQNVSACP